MTRCDCHRPRCIPNSFKIFRHFPGNVVEGGVRNSLRILAFVVLITTSFCLGSTQLFGRFSFGNLYLPRRLHEDGSDRFLIVR
jgi:hypothetical protein